MQGPMAHGSKWEGAVSGLRLDDGGGVAIAYVNARRDGLRFVGEMRLIAFEVACQVHEPQHFDYVADCIVLGCGLPSSVHGAGDDGGGEHGHLAVCFGQG